MCDVKASLARYTRVLVIMYGANYEFHQAIASKYSISVISRLCLAIPAGRPSCLLPDLGSAHIAPTGWVFHDHYNDQAYNVFHANAAYVLGTAKLPTELHICT